MTRKLFSAVSILTIATLLLLPYSSFAQGETTTPPVETPTPEVVETVAAEPTATTNEETVAEAPIVQETIPSNLLEESANPQESDSLEEAIEVIDEATEERLEEEIIIEESATTTEPVIEIELEEEEIVEIIETATTEIAVLDTVDLEPKKEYTFAINGESIATEETPEWVVEANGDEQNISNTESDDKVTEAPGISIEDSSHLLNISGICADNYYVILIYKDAEGYNTNPSSYIYNRAFPCENGQYSYSLSELPFDLESGTFYLLVAGQGHTGPWKPISAMIPIGITVKTIMPKPVSASTTSTSSVQASSPQVITPDEEPLE